MAQIDNNLKKQLAKPQTWFCKYFPKRIRNVGEKEIADRVREAEKMRDKANKDFIEQRNHIESIMFSNMKSK